MILDLLPESPPLYPVDEIAAAPVRFFAAELIRETCFEELADEIPYATAVEIDTFRETGDPVYIAALVYVEKESQKGIVIGRGGSMIETIGRRAREKIEQLIDRPVYLELRVKVIPNWRRRPGRLSYWDTMFLPDPGEPWPSTPNCSRSSSAPSAEASLHTGRPNRPSPVNGAGCAIESRTTSPSC